MGEKDETSIAETTGTVESSGDDTTTTTPPTTEADIAAAADAIDSAEGAIPGGGEGGDREHGEHDEPESVKGMIAALKKHSDGTNVIKESITTFSAIDGSEKKGDVILPANDTAKALECLKEMIEQSKQKLSKKPKKAAKWDFRTSPHALFGKTIEDTYMAFILWARKAIHEDDDKSSNSNGNNDKDGKEGEEQVIINVSKAFRRLETFADWMEDTGNDLVEPPLTTESVHRAIKAWTMQSSIDKNGRLCWWLDIKKLDRDELKQIPPEESLRAFVWYSHYVMYHPAAQNFQSHGFNFVENVDKLGFGKSMTLFPMKLGVKIDRLTIGVLPVKMNACYILDSPKWMDLFMKFMGLFMSKKMKSRIVIIKEWEKLEEILGKECIPKHFGQLEGSLEVDLVEKEYFSDTSPKIEKQGSF